MPNLQNPRLKPKCTWYEENGCLVVRVGHLDKVWEYRFTTVYAFILKALRRKVFTFKDWHLIQKHGQLQARERIPDEKASNADHCGPISGPDG